MLRPDLRGPLGLEALDAEPPEPAPYSRLVWVRDLGCWLDGTVIISTVKTTPERNRFYRAQRAAQQEATASTCRPVDPLALADAELPLLLAYLKSVRATLEEAHRLAPCTPHATDAEIVELALAATLVDLGRDPETGGPLLSARRQFPDEFDAGQAYRANNPNNTQETQGLEASAQEDLNG